MGEKVIKSEECVGETDRLCCQVLLYIESGEEYTNITCSHATWFAPISVRGVLPERAVLGWTAETSGASKLKISLDVQTLADSVSTMEEDWSR